MDFYTNSWKEECASFALSADAIPLSGMAGPVPYGSGNGSSGQTLRTFVRKPRVITQTLEKRSVKALLYPRLFIFFWRRQTQDSTNNIDELIVSILPMPDC